MEKQFNSHTSKYIIILKSQKELDIELGVD